MVAFAWPIASNTSSRRGKGYVSNNKQQNREKSDIKFDLGNSDLNEEQKEILTQFLNRNMDVFATNLQELMFYLTLFLTNEFLCFELK
jgi:hypothetical protein